MNQEDSYGSNIRERMKESMSQPAGEWKAYNRRQADRWGYKVFIGGLIWFACIGFWVALNWAEHFFRGMR